LYYKNIVLIPFGVLCLFLLQVNNVFAETLQLDKDASTILHWGAALLLYAHIGGGFIGMLAGTTASLAPKGKVLHRKAGKVFYLAMFICYLIGACVAPFLETGQRTNFVAGVLALYLLTSGVSAAQRRNFCAGISEKLGVVVALTITLLGILFIYLSSER
jgi:ABC-type transport system involved in cytochrome c biogenesis permease subunit